MKVLVGCERSGVVREAFRNKGHDAWSCDLVAADDKSSYHIQNDIHKIMEQERWDLMIAHPPCTFICRNSARINKTSKQRQKELKDSRMFFMLIWTEEKIPKICIENPVPSKESNLPKYTQIIQPYQFGHDHSKKTCLWLKGLPQLKPTKLVEVSHITTKNGYRYTKGWYETPRNSVARSRSFEGIAAAMAEQWS